MRPPRSEQACPYPCLAHVVAAPFDFQPSICRKPRRGAACASSSPAYFTHGNVNRAAIELGLIAALKSEMGATAFEVLKRWQELNHIGDKLGPFSGAGTQWTQYEIENLGPNYERRTPGRCFSSPLGSCTLPPQRGPKIYTSLLALVLNERAGSLRRGWVNRNREPPEKMEIGAQSLRGISRLRRQLNYFA